VGIVYFCLLYKCHNKKFVYSIWQTTTFHYSAKVLRLSTIWQKSKTLSHLDFVLCSMNRPLHRSCCCRSPRNLMSSLQLKPNRDGSLLKLNQQAPNGLCVNAGFCLEMEMTQCFERRCLSEWRKMRNVSFGSIHHGVKERFTRVKQPFTCVKQPFTRVKHPFTQKQPFTYACM
jgi:hypothetical protein